MKKIKLEFTLYNPKELWTKFWNRFYWPRRKQCAEWLGMQGTYQAYPNTRHGYSAER